MAKKKVKLPTKLTKSESNTLRRILKKVRLIGVAKRQAEKVDKTPQPKKKVSG